MTVEDLITRCSEAGLKCDRNKINRLVRERVLAPQQGGGGQGKMGHYPPGTDLRLLCALTLEQPPPRGLGYTRAKDLRAFLGAIGAERTVDEFLPAVAYVLEVPGIDAEEARQAGIRFARKQYRETLEELKSVEQSDRIGNPAIEALIGMGMGRPAYRSPDIYNISDAQSEPANPDTPELTLREELMGAISLPDWTKPYHPTSDELARVIQINRFGLRCRALKHAPEPILREAAFWARVLTLAIGGGPAPRGETLLSQWTFVAVHLLYSPQVNQMCKQLKASLAHFGSIEKALSLIENAEFGRQAKKGDFDGMGVVITNELCSTD